MYDRHDCRDYLRAEAIHTIYRTVGAAILLPFFASHNPAYGGESTQQIVSTRAVIAEPLRPGDTGLTTPAEFVASGLALALALIGTGSGIADWLSKRSPTNG